MEARKDSWENGTRVKGEKKRGSPVSSSRKKADTLHTSKKWKNAKQEGMQREANAEAPKGNTKQLRGPEKSIRGQ